MFFCKLYIAIPNKKINTGEDVIIIAPFPELPGKEKITGLWT
jgi:hypothetical protein